MIASSASDRLCGTEAGQESQSTVLDAICVAVLIAYFLHFAFPALHGGFRQDEMMNMGIYWCAGALRSMLANLVFWKVFVCTGGTVYDLPLYLYRPGGAIYYLPLYHFFHLNPLPYRIAQISILATSVPIVYYLSRSLTLSRSVAFLAVLGLCYHPRLANLVFVGAFIYDVLCGLFYFAPLAYYVHIREKGVSLRPLQMLGFLVLYVCALNCKEMAVTLPVMVLCYELLKPSRWTSWKTFLLWGRSYAAPSLIAGLLAVFYICGKTHGTGSLASLEPYRPSYSWHNLVTSNAKFIGELLFGGQAVTPLTLLITWAVVFAYAFLRRDRTLRLMAFWIVIVPLPLAFIVPIRGDASLYLLLFGWAMILAKAAFDLITVISKFLVPVGNRVLGWAGGGIGKNASIKVSPWYFRIIATVLVACAFAACTQRENQRLQLPFSKVESKPPHVIETFQSLGLSPRHGSRILLLLKETLFHNKWNVLFIATLVWNDHSLRIWIEDLSELTPQQQASVDYVISVSEFDAEIIRSPEHPSSN